MSIFTVNLTEHFLKVPSGAIGDLSKINPPVSVRAKSLEYDVARRIKTPVKAPLKAPVTPLKAPVKAPVTPLKAPVAPLKAPVTPLKAPVTPVSSKVIDDLKIYTKDMNQKIQNTVNDLEKLKTVKLDDNMWKFTDELGESGKVAKQIDEGGSAIMVNGVVKGKVEAGEITANLKKLEVDPPKDIDDAALKIKNTSEDRLKQLGDESNYKKTIEWVSNNKKLVAGVGLTAVIGGGIAIAAAIKEKEKSNATYNIVSIDDISTSSLSLAKVIFKPGEKISKMDYLMFSDTNCDPPLPFECQIYNIDSDFQVQVIIPRKLIRNGTSGTMKIKTSFGNQYNLLLTDTTKELANVTGEIAGSIVEGTADVTKEVVTSFWERLGLPDLTEYWWVLLIICILLLLSSSSLVALQVM
jgi:hypothetical protein